MCSPILTVTHSRRYIVRANGRVLQKEHKNNARQTLCENSYDSGCLPFTQPLTEGEILCVHKKLYNLTRRKSDPLLSISSSAEHIPWVPETFLARFPVSVKSS